jgi:environmental stress-induced protein Ves
MTIQKFNQNNFVDMPWKNGGGNTTELFKIPNDNNFFFRISIATVHSSGPFSQFPNVDRNLLLLEGNGFKLTGAFGEKILTRLSDSFSFPGEWVIDCSLVEGPCKDLNIMCARDYAKSSLSLHEISTDQTSIFTCECDLKFLYDKEEHLLYKLETSDQLAIKSSGRAKVIYAIDVELL